MVLALLAVTIGADFTGWLYTTNEYWGVQWVARLHFGLADLLALLIVVHVAGVTFTSFRQQENLVWAMVNGRKPAATTRHPECPADF